MDESLDLQLSRLNLKIEQLISNPLSLGDETFDMNTEGLQVGSPRAGMNSSFLSDSKYFQDNNWAEEVELSLIHI